MTKIVFIFLFSISSLFANSGKLRYVIDGDTIVFKTKKNKKLICRLAWIDSPESKRNKKATRDVANCKDVSIKDIIVAGRYSKHYLKSILKKGNVYKFDIISTDRYGRKVCSIGSLNTLLVSNGFAVPFWKYIRNEKIAKQMKNSLKKAIDNKKGLWRTNFNVMECMSEKDIYSYINWK